jgi:hypothetical protein
VALWALNPMLPEYRDTFRLFGEWTKEGLPRSGTLSNILPRRCCGCKRSADYSGHIESRCEITFGQEAALKSVVSQVGEVIVKGSFRYQACDGRKCYVPEEVPLVWSFKCEGLDCQPAPSEFHHKPK